jgi:hypothetical protein
MNCLLVKNIETNEYTTYYGKKDAISYANSLLESPSDYEIIGNESLCDVYMKSISKGYLYNSGIKIHLYKIQIIDILFDKNIDVQVMPTLTKKEFQSQTFTPLQQELIDELKITLLRRRQIISGEIEFTA